MIRPTIGVTVSRRSGWRIFPLIRFNLWLAGAHAVRWTTERDVDWSVVDGVVIGGGDDISPMLYGGDINVTARLDPARDAFEKVVAEQALLTQRPVLGICRGAQMLNIALGGTLLQDAWAAFPHQRPVKTILPRRRVQIMEGSQLATITGPEAMQVNALHTQAVARLGSGLRVAARDCGGMIQAVERAFDPFALGVQWHPEHLFYARRQRSIFSALAQASAARMFDANQIAAAYG